MRRWGSCLKKGRLLPPFEEVSLILKKGIGSPHSGLKLPLKRGNRTLGRPWGGASPPFITRMKDLHPWSPRTLKDPLYIRPYFLSPLFFLALSLH